MALTPAVFLDKDGTVLADVPYNVDPARMAFAPGVEEGLRLLGRGGVPLIVISNQPGVAMGLFDVQALDAVRDTLAAMFERAGARLAGMYFCPHRATRPGGPGPLACACRKPQPGLLRRAAAEHDVDLAASWMVGDILDDVEAGKRVGCRTVLVDNGNETQWRPGPFRTPDHRCQDFAQAARIVAEALWHPGADTRRAA